MVMLGTLMQNPEVEQYLRSFPHAQRQRCLELTMLLGVQTAKKYFPYGVTLEALGREVEKQGQSELDPGAMLERLRRIKGELLEEGKTGKRSDVPEPHANGVDSKQPRSVRPSAELLPSQSKSNHRPSITRQQKPAPETHKERPISSKKAEAERYMPVQPPSKVIYDDEDDLDTKETRIKPYIPKSTPYRHSKDSSPISRTESKGKSAASGPLTEPRTNLAYVGKLSPGLVQKPRLDPASSILRITDDFLADPFLALLSKQTSPKPQLRAERR